MLLVFIGLVMFLFFGFIAVMSGGRDPSLAKPICIGFILMVIGIPIALIEMTFM